MIFLNSYRFLDASLDKLSTTESPLPSLDANGVEDGMFKGNWAYSSEKCQYIKSFYKQQKLGRENYISTLKQAYSDFEEIIRTQAVVVKSKITNLEEIAMLYLINLCYYYSQIFSKII